MVILLRIEYSTIHVENSLEYYILEYRKMLLFIDSFNMSNQNTPMNHPCIGSTTNVISRHTITRSSKPNLAIRA